MTDINNNLGPGKPDIWSSEDLSAKDLVGIDRDIFPSWDTHPLYGQFGRRLNRELDAETLQFTPKPFAIMYKDEPQIFGFCTTGGETLSSFGLPLNLAPRPDMGKKREKKVFAEAFKYLAQLGHDTGASTAQILGGTNEGPLGAIDLACLNHAGSLTSQVNAIVDVTLGEVEIRKNLRDSYRSLINWGSRQLQMRYVNGTNTDRSLFDLYPEFHAKTAGGSVRGENYWNVFWEEIKNGKAELSLGFLEDGSLVSGTIITDAGKTSYYTSGVYDRTKFEKPLGHYPVFDAMIRSGERGMKLFDLGQIFSNDSDVSEKEQQIGFFKKGFTSHFQIRFVWTVNL